MCATIQNDLHLVFMIYDKVYNQISLDLSNLKEVDHHFLEDFMFPAGFKQDILLLDVTTV